MDLAKSYHNFAKQAFPNAIRKRLSKSIPSRQAKQLKRSKKLLGKRHDSLTSREQEELSQVYYLKESLIDWYDYSNKSNFLPLLNKWIQRVKF